MSHSVSVNWVEIVVPVGAADIDDVAARIASEVSAAAAGTEERGDEVVFWVPQADAAAALAEARDAATRWQAGGLAVDPTRVRIATALPEAEWRDAWKKYFRVSRLTRQFVVVPSWETFAPGPDDIALDLDPGMAFGTGTHASTRLVLEEIQALADRGTTPTRILDVGCGSGILAIAAVKRWPGATCTALDTDPIAVDATRDNAAINRVTDRISARVGSLDGALSVETSQVYDLVLANIQANVLRELAPGLIASTAPGGTLILSGLLTPQARPLADELVAAGGLRCERVRASTDDPQWSCAVLVR
ncbi:MAG TPA: 50S ribosomal protein L11 methyltransferase [Kofleriaceae bacterium]|nr:50S ribosomal protein L11 methyltransferase [Kofleriaceae bacterium]